MHFTSLMLSLFLSRSTFASSSITHSRLRECKKLKNARNFSRTTQKTRFTHKSTLVATDVAVLSISYFIVQDTFILLLRLLAGFMDLNNSLRLLHDTSFHHQQHDSILLHYSHSSVQCFQDAIHYYIFTCDEAPTPSSPVAANVEHVMLKRATIR